MAFDYKKEYKEYYMPKDKPQIVDIPKMNYAAVFGKGDPNKPESGYKTAIGLLYAVSYTIKMSYKGEHTIKGFFEYVVPPLEGFWKQEGVSGVDYSDFILDKQAEHLWDQTFMKFLTQKQISYTLE